jgi:hypothetical protein
MNIKEVKERVERFAKLKTTVAHNKGDYESIQDELNQVSFDIPTDFAYLLSIIEQAEKALEKVSQETIVELVDSAALMGIAAIKINNNKIIAEEALQAIRGKQ